MTTLIGSSATAAFAIADPVFPDGISIDYDTKGGYHDLLIGGKGLDFRTGVPTLNLKWQEITYGQFTGLSAYFFSGVTLYLRLPDYGTTSKEWIVVPGSRLSDKLVWSNNVYLHNVAATFYGT